MNVLEIISRLFTSVVEVSRTPAITPRRGSSDGRFESAPSPKAHFEFQFSFIYPNIRKILGAVTRLVTHQSAQYLLDLLIAFP